MRSPTSSTPGAARSPACSGRSVPNNVCSSDANAETAPSPDQLLRRLAPPTLVCASVPLRPRCAGRSSALAAFEVPHSTTLRSRWRTFALGSVTSSCVRRLVTSRNAARPVSCSTSTSSGFEVSSGLRGDVVLGLGRRRPRGMAAVTTSGWTCATCRAGGVHGFARGRHALGPSGLTCSGRASGSSPSPRSRRGSAGGPGLGSTCDEVLSGYTAAERHVEEEHAPSARIECIDGGAA
jgi:hypothetical protein